MRCLFSVVDYLSLEPQIRIIVHSPCIVSNSDPCEGVWRQGAQRERERERERERKREGERERE